MGNTRSFSKATAGKIRISLRGERLYLSVIIHSILSYPLNNLIVKSAGTCAQLYIRKCHSNRLENFYTISLHKLECIHVLQITWICRLRRQLPVANRLFHVSMHNMIASCYVQPVNPSLSCDGKGHGYIQFEQPNYCMLLLVVTLTKRDKHCASL